MAPRKFSSDNKKQKWNFDNPLNNLQAGAEMEGCLLDITEIDTSYGKREIALIRTEDGVVNAVFLPTALKTYLSEVPVCSPVYIKCIGKTKSEKTKRRYWDFEVAYNDEWNCCEDREADPI